MTIETIDKRIAELQTEQANLTVTHERTVQQFQQIVASNQSRFQQIKGAIDAFNEIKSQLNGAS